VKLECVPTETGTPRGGDRVVEHFVAAHTQCLPLARTRRGDIGERRIYRMCRARDP
jgi:hypothetical protein